MNPESVRLATTAEERQALAYERMIRTRRILGAALAVLIILLLIAFIFLLKMFQPVGKIANREEAKGIEWVRSIYGWGNSRTQQIGTPQGVAFGPDGTIWVTDAGMARIIGFNPDGSFKSLLHQGPRGTSPGALSFPSSIACDQEGVLYVGDMTASQVVVMTQDNKVLRRITVPRPRSLDAFGGTLVVGSTPGFVVMSTEGKNPVVIGTRGSGDQQFDGVSGVAFGRDGTIYVADQYNNRVSAYSPDGARKWVRATGNAGNQLSPAETMRSQVATAEAAVQLPSGIAVDGAGRVVLLDAFGFQIVVLDPKDGHFIARYGDAGVEDGKFVYPSSISYDPAHDYFAVADTSMGRVQIIRIPGSGGSAMAGLNRLLLGPLRACLVPLALLFLVIAGGTAYRIIRRRKEAQAAGAPEVPDEAVAEDDESVSLNEASKAEGS